MNILDKKQLHYTSLFCEENIWKLIESSLSSNILIPIDVIFILNEYSSIALFEQNKSISDQAVIWDYHVVLSAQIDNQLKILDFDSRCDFPCDINTYFNKTFVNYSTLENRYKPLIKAISADYYYQNFTSNRQHMKGVISEADFPDYEIIKPENTSNMLTLNDCRALHQDSTKIDILTPSEYLEHLHSMNSTRL